MRVCLSASVTDNSHNQKTPKCCFRVSYGEVCIARTNNRYIQLSHHIFGLPPGVVAPPPRCFNNLAVLKRPTLGRTFLGRAFDTLGVAEYRTVGWDSYLHGHPTAAQRHVCKHIVRSVTGASTYRILWAEIVRPCYRALRAQQYPSTGRIVMYVRCTSKLHVARGMMRL